MREIINRIKELRISRGWTQDELAERLNVKRAAISKYENGKIPLTAETIGQLTEIFDVSSDYILGFTVGRKGTLPVISLDDIDNLEDDDDRIYKLQFTLTANNTDEDIQKLREHLVENEFFFIEDLHSSNGSRTFSVAQKGQTFTGTPDDYIKFALFGDTEIDDDVMDEVRAYASFVAERKKKAKNADD
ncbi:MAG: helix-turn-helix domain-containing protein [Oscillospiraceae bacterium]|nr:helix-turn-helix domain-containing protein [Oscillospiraceae bacterium]